MITNMTSTPSLISTMIALTLRRFAGAADQQQRTHARSG